MNYHYAKNQATTHNSRSGELICSKRAINLFVVQTAAWLDVLYYSNTVIIYILAIILKHFRD